MKERFEVVGHVEVDLLAVDEVTDSVGLQELRIRGRGAASGVPTEMKVWMLGEVDENGQVVWMREFLDHSEADTAAADFNPEADSRVPRSRPSSPGRPTANSPDR